MEKRRENGKKKEKEMVEKAKASAALDGWGTSEQIKNYGIKSQKALIEIAKIAAAQSGKNTSFYIQNYGIKDQKALIEVAKIAATQSGWGTSINIQNYGIKDQKALVEIAKIAAAQNGEGTSLFIKNYGITDQRALIEIAKIAADHHGMGTSQYIKNYGITDQKVLIEIVRIAVASQNSRGISYFIKNYGITDQKVLIEIAKISAAISRGGTSESIERYGITDQKALIEIAKIEAAHNGVAVSRFIERYGITDQKALVEIAKIAAGNSWGFAEYVKNYDITNQKDLFEIAKIAVRENIVNLDVLGKYELSDKQVKTIHRKALHYHPIDYLKFKFQMRIPNEIPIAELKQLLLTVSEKIPHLLSPATIMRAWDKVQKQEVGLRLIRFHEKCRERGIPIAGDSTQLLLKGLGIEKKEATRIRNQLDTLSINALGEFYEIILDIDFELRNPLFKDITIEESLWNKKNFTSKFLPFLHVLRNLIQVSGNNNTALHSAVKQLRLKEGIYESNVDKLRENAKLATIQEVKNVFQDINLNFTYEDLKNLERRWGKLDPFFTLIARFRGNQRWHNEIPVLAKVFQMALKDDFLKYKFKGDPHDSADQGNARAQLKAIWEAKDPEHALKAWTSIWSDASAISNDDLELNSRETSILSAFINNDISQLERHMRDAGVDLHISTLHRKRKLGASDIISQILNFRRKTSAPLQELRSQNPRLSDWFLVGEILDEMSEIAWQMKDRSLHKEGYKDLKKLAIFLKKD